MPYLDSDPSRARLRGFARALAQSAVDCGGAHIVDGRGCDHRVGDAKHRAVGRPQAGCAEADLLHDALVAANFDAVADFECALADQQQRAEEALESIFAAKDAASPATPKPVTKRVTISIWPT